MIKIEDLWKEYRLGNSIDLGKNFREALIDWFSRAGRNKQAATETKSIWALREINLDIPAGKSIGIVGDNGAGKSTLLKVMSRITPPTRGRIVMRGSVSSLLEVGTGFHPELTGRENIYLNGSILGMSRRDIDSRMDQIVSYAEIEPFLDTPVKRYSSGMYVRLAFSIAAHIEPDILIVDEVLAVGDQAFRQKCLGKLDDVSQSGRTVLYVSHNLPSVVSLCEETIWLDQGQVKAYGKSSDIVARYRQFNKSMKTPSRLQSLFKGPLAKKASIDTILVNGHSDMTETCFYYDQDISIELSGQAAEAINSAEVSISFYHQGVRLFTAYDVESPQTLAAGKFRSSFLLRGGQFKPGTYQIGIGVRQAAPGEWMWAEEVLEIILDDNMANPTPEREAGILSVESAGARECF